MAHPVQQPDAAQVLTKALLETAPRLGLSQRDLAQAVGVSEATVSRWFRGQGQIGPNSKEGELALLIIRIFRSLDALLGGNERQVEAFMRADNRDLGGSPHALIGRVEGLVHVVTYLDAMRGKL